MPIYNFQCEYCGNVFEELTFDYNKRETFCPLCEDNGIAAMSSRIMSSGSFIITGFSEANGYSRNQEDKT